MKNSLIILIFLTIVFGAAAQSSQQQKNDSLSQLVKKYVNERSVDQLYQLTGESFQKKFTLEKFKSVAQSNLFPLGKMEELVFDKNVNELSVYKAVFTSGTLLLLVHVDPTGKLDNMGFQPYTDPNTRKNDPVSFSNPLLTTLDRKVDSIAISYIGQLNTVGLSIGVLKDGKIHYYGYGETAKGDKKIPDSTTIFEVGSVSKTFTATLLAVAVGEGRCRLDDPANKYLPDSIPLLKYKDSIVTLRDLSNHTSAIPTLPSNFQAAITDIRDPYRSYSVAELYSFLKHLQLTREPGSKFEYSNTAVGLLGTILQTMYHKSYEELILQYICNPLGMKDTRVSIRKNDSSSFAKGYDATGSFNEPWNLPFAFAGAGAIRSTARDMLKYAKANIGPAPGPLYKAIQLTHEPTFADAQASLGLAWIYIQAGDRKVLFHNGATGGYRTFLAIDITQQIAVILLCNSAIGPDDQGSALMKWLENN